MKKTILTTGLFFLSLIAFCQTESSFQPGWYIIQKGAQYGVILPSYADAVAETGKPQEIETGGLTMAAGEVVLAFDQKNGLTYCFDPLGRLIVLKSGIKKAPTNIGSGVGIIIEDIELIDSDDIKAGSYVWIVGQDVAKSSITIQLTGDKTLEIPKINIELITKAIRNIAKEQIEYRAAN